MRVMALYLGPVQTSRLNEVRYLPRLCVALATCFDSHSKSGIIKMPAYLYVVLYNSSIFSHEPTPCPRPGVNFSVLFFMVQEPLNLFGFSPTLASLYKGITLPVTAELLCFPHGGLLGCISTD